MYLIIDNKNSKSLKTPISSVDSLICCVLRLATHAPLQWKNHECSYLHNRTTFFFLSSSFARGKDKGLSGVWADQTALVEVLGSFCLSRRERNVVVQEDVRENDLDVRGSEEAARACRLPLAKGKTLGACGCKLMSVGLCFGRHSLVVEAEAVKCLGVRVDIGVSGYGVAGHGDVGSNRQCGAILELERPSYLAVESHYRSQSASINNAHSSVGWGRATYSAQPGSFAATPS